MPHTLTATALSKRFGAPIFRDVSFALDAGTITALTGSNGSGKSTLLRICAGIVRPSSGRVERGELSIALLPERFTPPGNLTAASFLTHMAGIRAHRRPEFGARSVYLVDRLGLRPGPDIPMRALSKGNVQKVGIAQAFASEADVLILDEPAEGLDAEADATLDELILEARDRGGTILVSGHARRFSALADRTLVLAGGTVAPAADPTDDAAHDAAHETGWRIRLVATRSDASPDELRRGPHLRMDAEGGQATVIVLSEDVDHFLRFALDNGWSPREVHRA